MYVTEFQEHAIDTQTEELTGNKPKALESIKVSKNSGMSLIGGGGKEVINSMWDPILTQDQKKGGRGMGEKVMLL